MAGEGGRGWRGAAGAASRSVSDAEVDASLRFISVEGVSDTEDVDAEAAISTVEWILTDLGLRPAAVSGDFVAGTLPTTPSLIAG